MARGLFFLNTPASRSSASLVFITCFDQRFAGARVAMVALRVVALLGGRRQLAWLAQGIARQRPPLDLPALLPVEPPLRAPSSGVTMRGSTVASSGTPSFSTFPGMSKKLATPVTSR